jgi:hypothetical protein
MSAAAVRAVVKSATMERVEPVAAAERVRQVAMVQLAVSRELAAQAAVAVARPSSAAAP